LLETRAMASFELRFLPLAAALVLGVVACSAADDPTPGGAGEQDTFGAELPVDPAAADDGDGDGDDGEPADIPEDGDIALVTADETVAPAAPSGFATASNVKTTANLNLRKAPSTSAAILAVIPAGTVIPLLDPTPQNGFLKVEYSGTVGWSYSSYLVSASASGGTSGGTSGGAAADPDGAPSPANAVARAAASVGFSYYWGGGAWLASGPTSSTKGSCSGSCPSCSHSGKYGADCSGMVAKAWQFGTKTLSVNSHPYSTATFVKDVSGKWKTVSRGSLKRGDALVYNSGGAGHIVLWEKGDGWGSSTVYECKGCSYGCVHDTRTFSSSYHGIRRAGF
jgi:cell wall-associated NlpC family hydrolase